MICSAAAFQSPDDLEIAVLASEQNLAQWDWMKWLPHSLSTEQTDAVGPMRMVSTSLDDLATLLPPDLSERPRFGADERPATPHLLFVVDGGLLPPGNHVVPPDGLHGVTVLDLPSRWDELDDASCLRLQFEASGHGQTGDSRYRFSAWRGWRRTNCRRFAQQSNCGRCAAARPNHCGRFFEGQLAGSVASASGCHRFRHAGEHQLPLRRKATMSTW